jgi:magnesium-transporting ATPase (P-type)
LAPIACLDSGPLHITARAFLVFQKDNSILILKNDKWSCEEKFRLTEKDPAFDKTKTEEVLRSLHTDLNVGLKVSEVEARLKQYGYNEVPEKKTNPLARFAKRFWGLTAWMLEIIIIISWFLHRYPDLYIVTGLLGVVG